MAFAALPRLVEPGTLRLVASELDAIPAAVAPLLGGSCSEVSTAGDGACVLHAAFGTPVTTDQVRLEKARSFLQSSSTDRV